MLESAFERSERLIHDSRYICPKPTQKSADFFQKSGVRGSTLKWDLILYCEIPPPILAKLQDGASAISVTNCYPSENSYELFTDVSTLAQQGRVFPRANVETCGSMLSPLVIRSK